MDTKLKKMKKEVNKRLYAALIILFGGLFLFGLGSGLWVSFILALTFTGIVYLALKDYVDSIFHKYAEVIQIIERLAKGNFEKITEKHLGMFEPIKEELCCLQEGFQTAVEKEVKSTRMKTELITNVSHDLKTPLTAITTYVELLKKEDIMRV